MAGRTGLAGSVVLRFAAGEPAPDAVAKVSPQANDDLQALRKIAPGAERAGARIPQVLCSGQLASVPFVLQSAVSGCNAAILLEKKRVAPRDVQERIAALLERWGRSSARVRALSRDDLERLVLSTALEVRPLMTGRGPYLEYLKALCFRAIGVACPFVSSHGDLAATNMLLDERGELGVVDWEEASEDSLPLTDFFYAAADVVAATRGYSDRPGAFASCYVAGGVHAPFVAGLRYRLAQALGVDEVVQEVCFHACWLQHAAKQASRSAHPGSGHFAAILRTIASEPERFRLLEPTR